MIPGTVRYVRQQIGELQRARNQTIRNDDTTAHVQQVRKLLRLRAIGPKSAWLFVLEVFGWRRIRNRRELAALHGLTPTPYASGESDKEQGISKAGNKRVRTMAVEIARLWLQWQPQSALAEWYRRRFGGGNARHKRIGIVALARRLLVALWRWLEKDEAPAGAELVDWRKKVTGQASELMPT
jgi:transposase